MTTNACAKRGFCPEKTPTSALNRKAEALAMSAARTF